MLIKIKKAYLTPADIKNIDAVLQEDVKSEKGKKIIATRDAIAGAKAAKQTEQVEEPIRNILTPGVLPPPVAPSVPQTVQDPFLDLVRSMTQ